MIGYFYSEIFNKEICKIGVIFNFWFQYLSFFIEQITINRNGTVSEWADIGLVLRKALVVFTKCSFVLHFVSPLLIINPVYSARPSFSSSWFSIVEDSGKRVYLYFLNISVWSDVLFCSFLNRKEQLLRASSSKRRYILPCLSGLNDCFLYYSEWILIQIELCGKVHAPVSLCGRFIFRQWKHNHSPVLPFHCRKY